MVTDLYLDLPVLDPIIHDDDLSVEKINMEGATTTIKPLNVQHGNSNIIRTTTTITPFIEVSMVTIFEKRNLRRQESTSSSEGEEAKPTTSSGPKDSTHVDDDSMQQTLLDHDDSQIQLDQINNGS